MNTMFVAACAAAFSCFSGVASAHVAYERPEIVAGSFFKGVLRVPHGCKGEPTHTVRLTFTEEIVGVKPMPKAGWKITTRVGAYQTPFVNHGRKETEGVREIVWSGGSIESAHVDEFAYFANARPEAASAVYTPVVQECANGSERWVEIPTGEGRPKGPAPMLRIAQAQPRAGADRAAVMSTYKVGSLTVASPWTRATPKGAPVAGGYVTITNNGAQADRLVGGSFAHAGGVEVHTMSMENGVMRMRQLPDGLEIKPGETVQLKPGGLHLMFVDLKQPVTAGATIKGSLRFEKAGEIAVEFPVARMGSTTSPGGMNHGGAAHGGAAHDSGGHGSH